MRRRLSWTFFSTMPFGHVAEVRIEQVMRAHHGKPGIDRAAFTLVDLVDSGLHVVVDATTRHPT